MSDNRFKRARENVDFVEDVNSDNQIDSKILEKVVTRNKNEVVIESNTLSNKERSRTKHGRNLSVPLFVEELEIIESAVSELNEQQEISVSNFIRQSLLERCMDILGKEKYENLSSQKRNVVKTKKQ